ncbi:ABC transporter substrate-binding protein [Rice orange leaf phytoplasma]|uniref:ABC transporter substrate-binding protein n=1 Tax=Rice orange leaf phytoplasma TaxID=146897 RepID=UPI0008F5EBA5|nr:ABC transporter substrate-binding protein [Rice orange leaf phytoplasma]OIJ45014.1 hypothetical protein BHE82_00440 [Rice orange leaf phytoplasma]
MPDLLQDLPFHEELKDLSGNEYYEKSKEVTATKFTFKFKEDLKFENGEPINAETLKYTLKRRIDPNCKNKQAEYIYIYDEKYLELKNAKKYYEQKSETKVDFEEVGVKAVQGDPLTFELYFDQPKNLFKVVNSLNMVILVPPKSYDAAFQNDAQTQSSYGTVNFPFQSYGPYVVKEWSNNQKFF